MVFSLILLCTTKRTVHTHIIFIQPQPGLGRTHSSTFNSLSSSAFDHRRFFHSHTTTTTEKKKQTSSKWTNVKLQNTAASCVREREQVESIYIYIYMRVAGATGWLSVRVWRQLNCGYRAYVTSCAFRAGVRTAGRVSLICACVCVQCVYADAPAPHHLDLMVLCHMNDPGFLSVLLSGYSLFFFWWGSACKYPTGPDETFSTAQNTSRINDPTQLKFTELNWVVGGLTKAGVVH